MVRRAPEAKIFLGLYGFRDSLLGRDARIWLVPSPVAKRKSPLLKAGESDEIML